MYTAFIGNVCFINLCYAAIRHTTQKKGKFLDGSQYRGISSAITNIPYTLDYSPKDASVLSRNMIRQRTDGFSKEN